MSATGRRLVWGLAAVALAGAVASAAVWFTRPRDRFDMVANLKAIADREGVWDNQWDRAKEKIAALSAALSTTSDPPKRFQIEREIARHYLYDGSSEGAIAQLEQMQKEFGGSMPREAAEALEADLAFAWFRMGEVENCSSGHNAESCLFPIKGKGVHQKRLGATEAVKLYRELLADPATDAESALLYRWLLNIGYQTLGQYPDGVPEKWLIPPEAFQSDADVGHFRDVAAAIGVSEFGAAGGVILEDFDNDGHLDLMLSHMGIRDQISYFHNDGDGTFTRMTEQAGLAGITGGLNIVQADFDNDGCIDVFIPRGAWLHDHGKYPRSLLRNNCDGTFTDVTARAGLLSYHPSQAAVWADFDGDGWLDLFIGDEIDREHVDWPASAKDFELWLNNRDGTFREVGATSGIHAAGMIKAVAAGDYDGDGKPDLYVSILGKPNQLYRNLSTPGSLRFEDVTARAGVAEPIVSFTCWFFDYDNDGWPDIFVSGYTATMPNVVREYLGDKAGAKGERPRLYHNNHDGTFTDVSRQVGIDQLILTMGANYGDLDNDGWLDFYLGTGAPALTTLVPNRMFRNDAGRRFEDVTTSGGFGNLQKGHAVAFGDIDGSGNQDVIEEMGGVYLSDRFWTSVYKNPGHPGNHWVKLRLTGVKANRFGVGGRIRLAVTGADGAKRDIYFTVGSGGSFGSSSLRPHIGLGTATAIDLLEIRWPGSGTVQRFEGPLAADRIYEIREDRTEAKVLDGLTAAARARK